MSRIRDAARRTGCTFSELTARFTSTALGGNLVAPEALLCSHLSDDIEDGTSPKPPSTEAPLQWSIACARREGPEVYRDSALALSSTLDLLDIADSPRSRR
ncbi:hypothetical protein VTO73DRAFT_7045 [Trametes versicolor]